MWIETYCWWKNGNILSFSFFVVCSVMIDDDWEMRDENWWWEHETRSRFCVWYILDVRYKKYWLHDPLHFTLGYFVSTRTSNKQQEAALVNIIQSKNFVQVWTAILIAHQIYIIMILAFLFTCLFTSLSIVEALVSTANLQCPAKSSSSCPCAFPRSPPSHHINDIVSHDKRKHMSKLESRITEQFSTFFDDEDIITMTPFESTFPFVSRLVGSPSQARNLISFLRQETSDIRQIIAFSLLGYTIPMLGNTIRRKFTKLDQVQYKKTKIYHLLNHISQGFKLGAVTTLIETISEMVLGLDASISVVMTNAVSSILFSIWGMVRAHETFYNRHILPVPISYLQSFLPCDQITSFHFKYILPTVSCQICEKPCIEILL